MKFKMSICLLFVWLAFPLQAVIVRNASNQMVAVKICFLRAVSYDSPPLHEYIPIDLNPGWALDTKDFIMFVNILEIRILDLEYEWIFNRLKDQSIILCSEGGYRQLEVCELLDPFFR